MTRNEEDETRWEGRKERRRKRQAASRYHESVTREKMWEVNYKGTLSG